MLSNPSDGLEGAPPQQVKDRSDPSSEGDRNEFLGDWTAADGKHDVLLTVGYVGHWRSACVRRQFDLGELLAGHLVVHPQMRIDIAEIADRDIELWHKAWRAVKSALDHDHDVFCDQRPAS